MLLLCLQPKKRVKREPTQKAIDETLEAVKADVEEEVVAHSKATYMVCPEIHAWEGASGNDATAALVCNTENPRNWPG
jgi:hypothetical protein